LFLTPIIVIFLAHFNQYFLLLKILDFLAPIILMHLEKYHILIQFILSLINYVILTPTTMTPLTRFIQYFLLLKILDLHFPKTTLIYFEKYHFLIQFIPSFENYLILTPNTMNPLTHFIQYFLLLKILEPRSPKITLIYFEKYLILIRFILSFENYAFLVTFIVKSLTLFEKYFLHLLKILNLHFPKIPLFFKKYHLLILFILCLIKFIILIQITTVIFLSRLIQIFIFLHIIDLRILKSPLTHLEKNLPLL